MPWDFGSTIVDSIAGYFGICQESARIMLTVVISIPLAFLYRIVSRKLKVSSRHIFFLVTGFLLYIFNFGIDVIHHIVATYLTFLLLKFKGKSWSRKTLISWNMFIQVSYLTTSYFFYETINYDINFTIPHCLLTLKLIAFGFDYLDGVQPNGTLSKDQQEASFSETPKIVEVLGFVFMTPAFLVGPVFGFKKYQRFIQGEFDGKEGFFTQSLRRFYYGMLYIVLRQFGVLLVPMILFLSPCLRCSTPVTKFVYISLFGKITLWKYAGIWLLSESALIAFGIGYDEGESNWTGCRNVNIRLLEVEGVRLHHYIDSMNIATNKWCSNYIYKRLKFLGSKFASFFFTMLFLSIWHGFHSGYYATFALEFFVINFEREFEDTFNKVLAPRISYGPILSFFTYIFLRIYYTFMFGFCVVPFIFLNYEDWSFVYYNISSLVYFVGWMYGLAFGLLILMKIL